MVLLSDFLRFRLSDARRPATLEWQQVQSLDWHRRRLVVDDLEAGRAAPAEALRRTVLAKRDLMDALVVDVGRRHTLRANDLWFREQDGRLWLAGADASPWAMLRRLGRGLLGRGAERLRGLHHPPSGLLAVLAILGPGLVAATAGDDAGGTATYSQAGAKFGSSPIRRRRSWPAPIGVAWRAAPPSRPSTPTRTA